MRDLLIITFIFIFSGCSSSRLITVRLHPSHKIDERLGQVTYILHNIDPDSSLKKLADKLGLQSFIISVFDHVLKKKEENNSSYHNLDSRTIFLTGLKNDSVVLIADINNNNRLDDDKIIKIDKKILIDTSEEIPFVEIKDLKTVYNSKLYIFSKKIFLSPVINYRSNLALRIISNEQSIGKFRYRGKIFYVYAKQKFSGQFVTDSDFVQIIIDKEKDPPIPKNPINKIYHLNDTVSLGKFAFKVEKVDPLLNMIIVRPITGNFIAVSGEPKRNEYETNHRGEIYPYINYLSDSVTKGPSDLKNKIIFINFWFTACEPCIKEFNALNKLYFKFKNDSSFLFISLTFESAEEIRRIKEKYSLLFDIYSLPESKISELNLDHLYPTNILIDKRGIIEEIYIGGEKKQNEADEFFQSQIIPKLSKILN